MGAVKKLSTTIVLCCAALVLFLNTSIAFAQTEVTPPAATADTYYRGTVQKILEEGSTNYDGEEIPYQKLEIILKNGPDAGKVVPVDNGEFFSIAGVPMMKTGEEVVVAKSVSPERADFYYIVDTYRGNRLMWLFLAFVAVTIMVGKWRGITSLVGLSFTILVLFYFAIPALLKGTNPLFVALCAAFAITFCSIYISHGFKKRTTVALVSTLLGLCFTIGFSFLSVWFARLNGSGTEDAFYLQQNGGTLDLRGILLAGIIISVLGILDDITTGTAAAVEEIHNANPLLSASELFTRGLSVGREHIASLVNTLLLAYTGSSLPLIILFTMQKQLPFFMVINSAFLAEEIVRTIIGSLTLILAVPITTALASMVWGYKKTSDASKV